VTDLCSVKASQVTLASFGLSQVFTLLREPFLAVVLPLTAPYLIGSLLRAASPSWMARSP
jgi:hypothetical protein